MANTRHARSVKAPAPAVKARPRRTATLSRPLRVAWLLSAAAAVPMLVATLAGLLVDDLYRGPASLASMLRGYDLVTLTLAVPALTATLVGVRRGSRVAVLVWVGMLAYVVYTYAIYLFGSGFNALFLVHVTVFGCALFALALALANLDPAALAARPAPRRRTRWIAGLLALLSLGLGGMWVYHAIRFAVTGEVPAGSALVETDAVVHLGMVLDLTLLVPAYAVAAVLLWREQVWGHVLAAVVLVSGTLHQVGYLVAMPFQVAIDVPGAVALDPAEPAIAAAFLLATIALLTGMRRPSGAGSSAAGHR
jgi:hypothetical protein